ncbi:MAG: carboxypeptidase regulatory-like domain-containing protein [Bryobacterales bacterium]|nr:carboxypeptidase regulatory-like domain-containing protein [Bryobacterales bacterium]
MPAPVLQAQFDTATVLGVVRDPSGLAISGAKVTLTSLGTGIRSTTTTDGEGNFQFLTVKAGDYRVSAEAQGFKTGVADSVNVTVNARQRVDLQPEIGATTETVTVGAQITTLETESSSRGTVVGTQQVVNLPLNGRSYADLALLAPGVRRSGIANSRDASFNVNGMRSSQNNFVVDGADNNSYGTSNQGFSNQVVQITPDAMQEFRLETNNFSAEFGRAGGAVINASIRSGTNAFHGSLWEYLRNTSLNATGFFKPVQNRKPVLMQNQFGRAIGGPIKREKAFFFADYEGFRRIQRTVQFATLPTMEMRQGILGIPIMNPYTGEVYNNGIVPSRDITRFDREVLNELPAPNRSDIANNYQSEPAGTSQSDKGDIRYDHYASSKLQGFVRYSHRLMNNFEPPNIPGPSGGNVRVMNWQWAFGGTYTVSPSSLMEFRMGISQTEGGKFPIFAGTQSVGERFNIPNIPNDKRFTGGIIAQSIDGFSQLGVQSSNPQFQNPFVINPKFNCTKIAGTQNLSLQSRRPIQSFGYIQNAFNGGFLNYHAFQTKVERRFCGGFYFLNRFTWSKGIDNASGHLEAQNGDNSRVNYRHLRNERGPSGYDQKFNNTTTVLFDVPFEAGNGAVRYTLGGWRVAALNFLGSGNQLTSATARRRNSRSVARPPIVRTSLAIR